MKGRMTFVFFLSFFLFAGVALAALPLVYSGAIAAANVARMIMYTPTGAHVAKSLTLHATVGGLAFAHWRYSDGTDSKIADDADLSGATGGGASGQPFTITNIKLSTAVPNKNPDSKRWTDAAPGTMNPIPKEMFDLTGDLETIPKDQNEIFDSFAPNYMGMAFYKSADENTLYEYVSEIQQIGRQPGAVGTSSSALKAPEGFSRQLTRKITQENCGNSTQPNCDYAVLSRKTATAVCPAGYERQGSNCHLTAPANTIMKPADTLECELYPGTVGLFETDWNNPTCHEIFQTDYAKETSDGVKFDNPVEESEVACKGDMCGVTVYDKEKDSWSAFGLGPADSNGNRKVTTVEHGQGKGTMPNAGDVAAGAGSGSGTGDGNGPGDGDGSGTGDSGSGLGSCKKGDPCYVDVDDSGFGDLNFPGLDDLELEAERLHDEAVSNAEGLKYDDDHGMGFTWSLPLPKGSCSPIEVDILGKTMTLDFCEKFVHIRLILEWLINICLVFFVFNTFWRTTLPQTKTD